MSFRRRLHGFLASLAAIVLLTAAGWWAGRRHYSLPSGLAAAYVGKNACIECHPDEHAKWHGSHHDRAMEPMTPETVLADFSGKTLEVGGVPTRFFTKDGGYFVETAGRAGKQETFELKYTFGVDPLQQYLAEFPGGRLQALPIAWDVLKKSWFHLYENENLEPSEWLYWTNWGMTWNHQCAECHSTNLEKNYDPDRDRYQTTWTDVDVSCEACHGPGSIHLEVVGRPWLFRDPAYGTGLAPLKSKDSQLQIDACGRCHSRRQVYREGFQPGDRLVDFYDPELLDTPSFHPDGQIHDEDYEYGSFHLSLMYAKGVRCTDCHDPHTAKRRAAGNDLCIRCHQAGKYDAPSHHFHEPKTEGALCTSCHMPTTTYMKVHPRHDHSFRIPRPEQTIELGIPNACNRCHKEKSAEWAREATLRWYGPRQRPARLDFAGTIAAGRSGRPEAESPLIQTTSNPEIPVWVRASAMALLRGYGSAAAGAAAVKAMGDPHPLLRLAAVRWFERGRLAAPPPGFLPAVTRTLADDSFPVRAETARVLAGVAPTLLTSEQFSLYRKASADFIAAMSERRDVPEGNYNLGNFRADVGDLEGAIADYRRALALEPGFNAARFNLAMTLYAAGAAKEAESTFQEVLRNAEKQSRIPDAAVSAWNSSLLAQAHFHLALLLAENPARLEETRRHLAKAVELDPRLDRAWYNLGLADQHLGRPAEAERALEKAVEIAPATEDYVYALAVLQAQTGRAGSAIASLRSLLAKNPSNQAAKALLAQLLQADR